MPKKSCPTCKKVFTYGSIQSHRPYPFCSQKCAAQDLGVWMTDGYAIECEPTAADLAELEEIAEQADGDEDPDGGSWSVNRPWRTDERN